MAGPTDLRGTGDGQAPSDDRQDVIRRALERFEQLRRAPPANKALQDRMLSELGVDPSRKGEPSGPGPGPSDF